MVRKERDVDEDADRLLRLMGLGEWGESYVADPPHGLSRLSKIAHALVIRPCSLLLDEPLLGVAPRVVTETCAALGRLKAAGMTNDDVRMI